MHLIACHLSCHNPAHPTIFLSKCPPQLDQLHSVVWNLAPGEQHHEQQMHVGIAVQKRPQMVTCHPCCCSLYGKPDVAAEHLLVQIEEWITWQTPDWFSKYIKATARRFPCALTGVGRSSLLSSEICRRLLRAHVTGVNQFSLMTCCKLVKSANQLVPADRASPWVNDATTFGARTRQFPSPFLALRVPERPEKHLADVPMINLTKSWTLSDD